MFGTRTVRHAIWTNGKKRVSGVWEYSTIIDKYDIWLDIDDPHTGNRVHHIVEGYSETGPEWKGWKIIKPEVENANDKSTTDKI